MLCFLMIEILYLNILIDDFNQKEPILEGDIGLGCYIKLLVKDKHER